MSVIQRVYEPSHIRRGRLAVDPVWLVVFGDGSGRRWRFQRKKDAAAFVAAGSQCPAHPYDERVWCRHCRGSRVA